LKTSKINIQLIVYLREEDQLLKFRNKFVSKRIGTKTLASLLAFGMALGSPMAVFADDGETAVVAENTVQAKKTDGSEVFVSVSDYVRGMMERGAVRLNDETGYLEDTSTGQKVDPETGERLTETPDVPETPVIPDTPGNQGTPESPGTPENPENPEVPEKPDTPDTPETPEKPGTPEKPDTPETPEKPGTPEKPDTPETPETPEKPGIPENPIPKIRFRNRILIRQILPKTGKIQRPTQFREVRSTIHRRSAKQKKQPVRTNQKLQSVILN
jgi:hypothetical protein